MAAGDIVSKYLGLVGTSGAATAALNTANFGITSLSGAIIAIPIGTQTWLYQLKITQP